MPSAAWPGRRRWASILTAKAWLVQTVLRGPAASIRGVAGHTLTHERGAVDADAGVESNTRLTVVAGTLLTLLLLVEGFTILDVRGMITLHTAVGLTLVGPIALKCASTGYRFLRYYTGKPAYVAKGAPHPALRMIGPLVIVSSVAVVGTGIALLAVHGKSDTWLTLHQGSFVVWIAVMTLHFLGHLREAAIGTAREMRRAGDDPARRGKAVRLALVGISLLVGVGVAAAFTPGASTWQLHHDREGGTSQH